MKKTLYFLFFFVSLIGFSQDVLMQNGTFNRCAPDKFFDSGGEFGNYGNNESFVTSICPQNGDEFIILDFIRFSTQLGVVPDTMKIFDGADTSATLIGSYSGTNNPGVVSATDANISGCLTIEFISSADGNLDGWEADILCATPCQDITASIDSTMPIANGSGFIVLSPGESVNFSGSGIFSQDGTNANYEWDFGDGNIASGTDVTNQFTDFGTYTVSLTVKDDNPQGCEDIASISVVVLGPNLIVDQDTYTPEQLIEDVLINSPCASVSNIIASTGTNFSATEPNGIGYFVSNGVDFPFEEGILLTSGDASEAAGPNGSTTIGAGTAIWQGDADLDAVSGTGTTNATFIQFDFTPLANSISFEFLMASEEYNMGSFECDFSDAFAFLLTDSMGNTTNLAVLPGTTTPILVTNIHQANASCGAINEEFFGGYTPAGGPPMAFDGRTIVFTAQSEVTPGENYTIKLVIGDDGNGFDDTILDSGVFLKAGSFDLGGDLGDDITIAAGTAACGGTAVNLDTGITAANHTWYFEGVEIPGETGSSIMVDVAGIYSVDIVFAGVCQSTDSVFVEFRASPEASPAQDLFGCSGNGTAEFDLSENDDDVLGTESVTDFVITYHLSDLDAMNNVNALPTNYTNVSNPQEIWARMADNSQSCYDVTSFSISASIQPTITTVSDLEVCDDDSNDGLAEFDLTLQTLGILDTQLAAEYNVSYHLSFADADSGLGALPDIYTSVNNPEPIFVRVESSGDSNCYNASATPVFNLVVNTRAIANTPDDMEVCDNISNDGIATFDLSIQESDILGSQSPVIFTVSFHGSQDDADNNVGELPTSYTNTTPNFETVFVRVEDPTNPDCYGTTSFNLVFNPPPLVTPPTPLAVCDDGVPDGLTEIDLSLKDIELSGNNPSYVVSYYLSLADAESATDALPTLYTNTSNGQIIFVRVEDSTTGCYATTNLELVVEQAPIAFTPTPLRYCDPDNDGFGVFTLSDADNEITGGAPGLTVSYHETQANANNNADAIDTSVVYTNIAVNTQTLYARVESPTIATNCATIVALELIVEPSPQLVAPEALEVCDDLSGDGFASFDLTTSAAEVLNGQDATQYILSYYQTQANAETATAAIGNPLNYTNTTINTQIIWIRVEDSATVEGCYKLTSLELIVHPLPVLVAPSPLELCDVNNSGDQAEGFILEDANEDILNGQNGITLSYYQTQADADAATSPLVSPYTNTMNAQTVYARAENAITGCYSTITLTLRVNPMPTPTPSEQLPDLVLCDVVNSGDGVEVFNLLGLDNDNAQEDLILNGEQQVTLTYHETAEAADSGTAAIPDPSNYENTQSPEQDIYVRMTKDVTGCYVVVNFAIIVNPLPEVVAVTDIIQCELNTDGRDLFDLTTKDAEVLNGQDATQFIVSYHVSLADAESQTGALMSPYTNIINPQPIFVRITNTDTGCFISTQQFNLQVDEAAQANPDLNTIVYELCDDTMETDGNPANDSVQFDLSTQDTQILDGQDPSNYIVSYYATEADATLNVNPLPNLYENSSNPQVIYARVDNNTPDVAPGNDTSICFAVAPLTLQVNPLPEFNLDASYTLCIDTNGTEILDTPVLDTELIQADYSFEWSYNGVVLPGETGSSLVPTQAGTYSVIVIDISTSGATNCVSMATTEVIESAPPLLTAEVVTQLFGDRNVIEAVATGIGNYEYSLDNGPWQDSGTFTNVSAGLRLITARDKLGCGLATVEVAVIDYPKYFTPNGDGTNETWNIAGIGSDAKIYIFDRYGKLLKQLSPTGQGWNGRYNGAMMPTSDYWFTVVYTEPITGSTKEFKAHFTLKR